VGRAPQRHAGLRQPRFTTGEFLAESGRRVVTVKGKRKNADQGEMIPLRDQSAGHTGTTCWAEELAGRFRNESDGSTRNRGMTRGGGVAVRLVRDNDHVVVLFARTNPHRRLVDAANIMSTRVLAECYEGPEQVNLPTTRASTRNLFRGMAIRIAGSPTKQQSDLLEERKRWKVTRTLGPPIRTDQRNGEKSKKRTSERASLFTKTHQQNPAGWKYTALHRSIRAERKER